VELLPPKRHKSTPVGNARVAPVQNSGTEAKQRFVELLQGSLHQPTDYTTPDPVLMWTGLRDALHSSAVTAFEKKKSDKCDRFTANETTLALLIASKCAALTLYKTTPSIQNLEILCKSRLLVQKSCSEMCKRFLAGPLPGNTVSS